MDNLPIGIFDSGIGGLTVAREIIKLMPNENIIYLGDTARVPYGNRAAETIDEFARQLTYFMIGQKVKALVVACNTMSSVSLPLIARKAKGTLVIDVITPTAEYAKKITQNKRVGVIGTRATIETNIYPRLLSPVQTFSKACPLFVPLAEEGMIDSPETKITAQDYLSYFSDKDIDTLILGCTHYPLLRNVIQEVVGPNVKIIDSSLPTALKLKSVLEKRNLLNKSKSSYKKFYVTDGPERVGKIANLFFEGSLPVRIEKVELS